VADISHGGKVLHRVTVIQEKTGRAVQFELTEQTRQTVSAWLQQSAPNGSTYLFPGRVHRGGHLATRSCPARVRYVGIEVEDALEIAESTDA